MFLLLFSVNCFGANQYSFLGGGWSQHWFDDAGRYNEDHYLKGIEFGTDKKYIGLYNFTNSYYNDSYMISYHKNKCKYIGKFKYCYGYFGGFVSGYEKTFVIAAPEVNINYNIIDNVYIGTSTSCIPGVCELHIKITFVK